MRIRTLVLSSMVAMCALGIAAAGSSAERPSPNTRIVFHGFDSVRSISPNGGAAKTLYEFPGGGSTPFTNVIDVAASTNGKRIAAVTSKISSGPSGGLINGISVFRGDGSQRRVQVPGTTSAGPNSVAITSDGQEIAFPSHNALFVSKVGSKAKRKVTTTLGNWKHPAFSKDGKRLVFENNTSGNQDLYTVATSGGAPTRLTHLPGDEANPSYSPDGKLIAYASDASGGTLHVMNANGSGDHSIVHTGTDEDAAPAFSPGGGSIVYVGKTSGSFRLFTIRVNGTHRKLVSAGVGAKDPQWTRG